jgi:5-methylcytosine-specific restriction protein B
MADPKGHRFTKYFPLLLDALRSTDPQAMRPAQVTAWIRARIDVPPDDLTRLIVNGKQTIFENDIHWARFYLAKAGFVSKPKRGLWGLTSQGRDTHLTPEVESEIGPLLDEYWYDAPDAAKSARSKLLAQFF